MIALPAHIMGLPIEETLGAFAPVAVVSLGALRATIGARRSARADRGGERETERCARPKRSANPR